MQDLISVSALLGSTCFCATTFLYGYPKLRGSPATLTFSSRYGLMLGLLYTIQHLARCRDVLAYPSVHRHRYFRLRRQMPALLFSSLRIAAAALAITAATGRVLPEGGAVGLITTLHAGWLCAMGYVLGAELLQIVFTERLNLGTLGSSTAPVSAALRPALEALAIPNAVVQDQVLQELALVAEGSGRSDAAWRATVFADETGATGWTPLAGFLLTELREFVGQVAAALPATAADARTVAAATSGGKSPAPMQWNVLSASPTTGLRGVSKGQDNAAWVVRANFHRLGFCIRALAALGASSRAEDRYGVVLLCQPALADVLVALLSCVSALQAYSRLVSSMTSRSVGPAARALQGVMDAVSAPAHPTLHQVEYCAYALEDLARASVYRLVRAFGPSLKATLSELRTKPPHGTPADAAALLASFLAYAE